MNGSSCAKRQQLTHNIPGALDSCLTFLICTLGGTPVVVSASGIFPLLLFHSAWSFYLMLIFSVCLNSLIYVLSACVICLGFSLVEHSGLIPASDTVAITFSSPITSASSSPF